MLTQKISIIFESTLTKEDAIRRRLSILYGTRKGEQALDRSFGLDWSFLDQPTEIAKAMLSSEIITKTAAYIPEVAVTAINFTADTSGNLTPIVSVEEVKNE